MHLKRLELAGFKSFAKKSELEFTTPITAIVGPNGSGKSNVAEAFRFVLGEQSVRSMRGKRTEDLIWNGSTTAPRSNRASAKLTFDNAPIVRDDGTTERLLPIDFDTVTIERVIHRDSSSEYLVNGSVVRLKDIVELLAGAHIGSSGHHIISQGEADRVLSVNPRERKNMIEDALGLKIYHYKKDESLRKLEKTNENMEKIEGLRREIKPHLNFLARQVEKLKKAEELAENLKAAYKEYFAREKRHIDTTSARLAAEESPLVARAEELEGGLSKAKETLAALETKDEKSSGVVEIEEKLKAVEEKKSASALTLGRIEGELEALRRQQAAEERRAEEEENATVLVSSIAPHLEELEKSLGDDATRESIIERVRRIVGAIKSALSAGRDTLDRGILKELTSRFEELSREKDAQMQVRAGIEAEERELREAYRKLQEAIEADRTSSRDAERAVFAFSNELSGVRVKLERVRGALEALRLENEEYKREIGEAAVLVGREAIAMLSSDVDPEISLAEEPRGAQEERKRAIQKMKVRLEDAGLAGADEIMKEYQETEERDAFLVRELDDLRASAASLGELIAELERTLEEEFRNGLEKINTQFEEFFSIMFGGGTAGLKIVREPVRRRRSGVDEALDVEADLEPEETHEGIEITLSLPRKKVRSLEMLSGGERALTSIALIFAMSQVNPPPFIILDETDAALDEANSKRYGDMIESLAKRTQLILITHNRETMSRAGVLYGVTMGRDAVSQLLSVSFTDAVEVAK